MSNLRLHSHLPWANELITFLHIYLPLLYRTGAWDLHLIYAFVYIKRVLNCDICVCLFNKTLKINKIFVISYDLQFIIQMFVFKYALHTCYTFRADSRLVPSQWETVLLCNDVSHWLGANLESADIYYQSYRYNNTCYIHIALVSINIFTWLITFSNIAI